jgi:hypothetical protein
MISGLLHMIGVPIRALVHIEPQSRLPMVMLSASTADIEVMIELLPADAVKLAGDLMRFAALAHHPGSCAGSRDTIPIATGCA